MKVKISLQEVQYFNCVKEVEITVTEYKQYLKTGKISREIKDEVSSNGEQYHQETIYLDAEIIK
jgi:hypothetical protein